MNRKHKIRINLVLGIVLAVFLVLMLALPFIKNNIFWISFLFGVIAIGIQFYVQMKALEGNRAVSKFYGFPIARIGMLYMVVQLVLSLLMSALGQWVSLRMVVIIYVLVIAIAAIGLISADTMREEVETLDRKLADNTSFMRNLRLSDPISSDAIKEIEQELFCCVDDLQKNIINNDAKAVVALCRRADAILAERNQQCKLNKR